MSISHIFHVTGMSCGHCEAAVRNALLALDPQAVIAIDLASGRVEVQSNLAEEELRQAIEAEGYAVAG